jgi:hypothetical protein
METVRFTNWVLHTRIKKPLRVIQPNSWYSSTYTAIPLHMLDQVRSMLRANGLKVVRTFYAGPRINNRRYHPASTLKCDANFAKIMVFDPRTKKTTYL